MSVAHPQPQLVPPTQTAAGDVDALACLASAALASAALRLTVVGAGWVFGLVACLFHNMLDKHVGQTGQLRLLAAAG